MRSANYLLLSVPGLGKIRFTRWLHIAGIGHIAHFLNLTISVRFLVLGRVVEGGPVLLPRVSYSDIIADVVITCRQLDPLEGPVGLPHVYCSDCLDHGKMETK